MKCYNTIGLLFLMCTALIGQNLLPNPSFEEKTNCPNYYGQINKVKSWHKIANHTGSPDYFNRCAQPSDGVSVPDNAWGHEEPSSGNAYIGFALFDYRNAEFREYIESQLLAPLETGTVYNISFNYSLTEEAMWASKDLGIYFSDTLNKGNNNWEALTITPHVVVNDFLNNKTGWTSINLQYKASGGEKYFLMGNFVRDADLTKKYVPNGTENDSYVYFDDVSVSICGKIYLGHDTLLCIGDTLYLDASTTNATYLWQDSTTASSYKITKPGKYWVNATLACGVLSDTILVTLNSPPSVDLGNDFSICPGNQEIIHSSNPNSTFLWQDDTTVDSMIVEHPGLYWLVVSNECGIATDSVYVDLWFLPELFLGNDTSLCYGDTLTLQSYIDEIDSLSWQNGSNQPTFSAFETGHYILTAFNRCGSDTDSIKVNFVYPPFPFNLGIDSIICLGDSITLSVPDIEGQVTWQDSSYSTHFIVDKEAIYFAEVKNLCGSSSDTIKIEVDDRLISLPSNPDLTLCPTESLILNGSQDFDANYLWDNGTTLSRLEINTPGTYKIRVSTECMEQEFEFKIVEDDHCSEKVKLYIPNVFSPNGDHINDYFEIYYSNDIEFSVLKFSVYDRWGSQVFLSSIFPIIWDGTYKNSVVKPGVYTYELILRNNLTGKTEAKYGDITILK